MEIVSSDKICIFTPLSSKLDKRQTSRLLDKITNDTRMLAINLDCVEDCTIDFIEGLKNLTRQKDVGIFNINSDVFAMFNLMGLDKCAKLYISEDDFVTDSRQLIKRDFVLV